VWVITKSCKNWISRLYDCCRGHQQFTSCFCCFLFYCKMWWIYFIFFSKQIHPQWIKVIRGMFLSIICMQESHKQTTCGRLNINVRANAKLFEIITSVSVSIFQGYFVFIDMKSNLVKNKKTSDTYTFADVNFYCKIITISLWNTKYVIVSSTA
jgi:hypothetical protein